MRFQEIFNKNTNTTAKISQYTKIPEPIINSVQDFKTQQTTLKTLKTCNLTKKFTSIVIAASICTTYYGLISGQFSLSMASEMKEKIQDIEAIPDITKRREKLLDLQNNLQSVALLLFGPIIAGGSSYIARGMAAKQTSRITSQIRDQSTQNCLERIDALEQALIAQNKCNASVTIEI